MSKIINAVLALAIAALASSAHAVATWEHFNADPAYHSREAAIADAPRVLRQAGYPEPVIALLTEAMKNPGVETHVTNGMKLDFMRSGKSALWRNVLVKFTKPPREKSMEFSAPSEEWTVEWNRSKWTVGIPKVCNNIYGKRTSPPVASAPPPVAATVCPDWTLVLRAYSEQSLPPDLRKQEEELVALANGRSSYRGDALSRTMGKDLYYKVQPTGEVDVQLQLLDPGSLAVVEKLGNVRLVGGVGTIKLSNEQQAKVVETIWPANFKSPTVSAGAHRNRAFPDEWGIDPCPPRVISAISVP